MPAALTQPKLYTADDYFSLPEDTRAELIRGQIYAMSAPNRIHQELLSFLHLRIGNYIMSSGGSCKIYPAPFAVRLFDDPKTIVEPDISVICDHSRLTDYGCSGAPDWVIEIISPGSPGHDYVRKLNLYADAGVPEYWIVDPLSKIVSVYRLKEQDLKPKTFSFTDSVPSGLFQDLSIDFAKSGL